MTYSRRYSLLTSLMTFLAVVSGAEAQTAPEVPHLVVNIVIEQLRTDYLEAFSPLFGERGFKRLFSEGRVYSQAEYPFASPDRASAIACLMSGASPYENGIVSQTWINRQTLQPIFCVDDNQFLGSETKEKSSPKNLGVSTISDELKVSTEGHGIVYSVAPNRDAAILLAGHAADGAFWLDDETGAWCSTSYYGEYPKWGTNYNTTSSSLATRIEKIEYEPINDLVSKYNYFITGNTPKEAFKHKFKGNLKYRQFKASACVNEEVNNFVRMVMNSTLIGNDGVTDMLNVGYYAGNFDHQSVSQCPMELQDTYVRLDRDLGDLFTMLDKRVGKGHVLYVVTSTGETEPDDVADLSKYRIPSGIFSIGKAQLLLNMYLTAVYGEGQYVETTYRNQIFLNLKLIEDRNINLSEMLERCSDFLIQLSGVRDVYTSERLALGAWTAGISKLRNAYNPKCSGDILLQISPGWTLSNESTGEKILSRESYMTFPLFFLGSNVESEKIVTPVTVDRVAPTLAKAMRIRAPNACAQAPLQ